MQRRDVEMLIVSLVAGPAIAPFIMFTLEGLLRFGPLGPTQLDFALVVATLPFAYLFATPAALAIGVGNAIAARVARPDVLRLLLSLPIGALAFAIGLAGLAPDFPEVPALIPMTGALVSLLCVALVGSFGTPLRGHE